MTGRGGRGGNYGRNDISVVSSLKSHAHSSLIFLHMMIIDSSETKRMNCLHQRYISMCGT